MSVQHLPQKQPSAMAILTRDSLGTLLGEAKGLPHHICLAHLVDTALSLSCHPSLITMATDRKQASTEMISCVNKPTSFAASRSV